VLEQLYAIVNERWQEQRAMLVTTNLMDRDRLREQIGERTVSRLSEMCETIPIMGTDLRSVYDGPEPGSELYTGSRVAGLD